MSTLDERLLAEWEQIDKAAWDLWGRALDPSAMAPLELAGVASLLSAIYNGIENILKQVVGADGPLPTGPRWHADLLDQAGRAGALDTATRVGLRQWLGFRHFFHHGYPLRMEPAQLAVMLEAAPGLLDGFRECINRCRQQKAGLADLLPVLRHRGSR